MDKTNMINIFKTKFKSKLSDSLFNFIMLVFLTFIIAESDLRISDYSLGSAHYKSIIYFIIDMVRLFPFAYIVFLFFSLSHISKVEKELFISYNYSKDDKAMYVFIKHVLVCIVVIIAYIISYNYLSSTRNSLTGKSNYLFILNLQNLIIFLSMIFVLSGILYNPDGKGINGYSLIEYILGFFIFIFYLFFIKRFTADIPIFSNIYFLIVIAVIFIICVIISYFVRRYVFNRYE